MILRVVSDSFENRNRKDKSVNKTDLVSLVAQRAQITKDSAADAVDATFDGITSALQSGDTVRIVGFGNFQVSLRKASTGRNPRTGAPIQIPASRIPKFKAGKALKEAVNR
jgi:DNA-binding protein HU-beta